MKRILGLFSVLMLAALPAQAEVTSLSKLLVDAATSRTCTYQTKDSQGTVYLAGGKMRADVSYQGQPTYVIRDAQWQYVWGGEMGQNQGVKMPSDMGRSGASKGRGQQGMDMDEEADYSCSVGPIDGGKFTVPGDVQFQDMSAMMNGAMMGSGMDASMLGDQKQMMCGACEQAPPDAQAQCRQALGC